MDFLRYLCNKWKPLNFVIGLYSNPTSLTSELIFMLFFLSAGFESESMALRLPPQTSQRMARHSGDHQNINHLLHLQCIIAIVRS